MARIVVHDFGTCLAGTGSSQSATRATSAYSTSGYSIAFWLNGKVVSGTPRIFSEGNSGDNNPRFDWQISTGADAGRIGINLFNDANSGLLSNIRPSKQVVDGRWHLLVWTDSNGTGNFYVDGVSSAPTAGTYNYTPSTTTLNRQGILCLARTTVTSIAPGRIDEFRTWSTVLTAQEVSDLYFNNIIPQTTYLTGELLCDEGSGTTLIDTGSAKVNGVISGATYSSDVFIRPRTSI
jgi:hypothetical protein